MLLCLAGVSGVGKSYYTNLFIDKLGFKRVQIITTRPPRDSDAKGAKILVTDQELDKLRREDKIAIEFEMLGVRYAYLKEALGGECNLVFELHYEVVPAFKRAYPDLKVLYLLPDSLDRAKDNVRQRGLPPEVEAARIAEIDTHKQRVQTDRELRKLFDYELYNYYNEESEAKILSFVKDLIEAEK